MRLVVIAFLCCVAAAGIAAASDFETLQGNWKLFLAINNGKPLTGAELDARLEVQGDHFAVQGPVVWPLPSGTFKLNDSASPKAVDLVGPDGKTALGIYEIRAGNRIRFCVAPAGAERPAKFESRPGSGYMFGEWRRVQ